MKKRLRKKKYLGEFKQEGFSVLIKFAPDLQTNVFNSFIDLFIAEVEKHNLLFGGGGTPANGWEGVVSRNHRRDSTTNHDQTVLSQWLATRDEVKEFEVSSNWDIWHGKNPFDK